MRKLREGKHYVTVNVPTGGTELEVPAYSLCAFRREIFDCFAFIRPKRIIEIGSDTGAFTRELTTWADSHGAQVVSIDPEPSPEVLALQARSASLHVIAKVSPEALTTIERGDVYVIDGDHNYWTVSEELQYAFAEWNARPLAVVHDVAWPCGRRDFYCAPERLPADGVHEHTWRGALRSGEPGIVECGFSVPGLFAVALHEGGLRNGVLTAVEDFLAAHPKLRFIAVPGLFGLGFVYPQDAAWAALLEDRLAPLRDSPLLEALERDRLKFYLLARQRLGSSDGAEKRRATCTTT